MVTNQPWKVGWSPSTARELVGRDMQAALQESSAMAEVAGPTYPCHADDEQRGDTGSGAEPIFTEAAAQTLR